MERCSFQARFDICFFIDKISIVLFTYCTLNGRVDIYFPPGSGKLQKAETKALIIKNLLFFNRLTVNIDNSCFFEELHSVVLSTFVKKDKSKLVFTTAHHFLFKNGKLEEQQEVGGRYKRNPKGTPRSGQS